MKPNADTYTVGDRPSRLRAVSANLLIVDRDPHTRATLIDRFDREGYRSRSAATGLDALALVFHGGIDLAIVELQLPDISGEQVCRRIRTNRALADLPIVVYTSRADEASRVAGLEAGADDYLPKTASFRELSLRVRAVLRRASFVASRCIRRGLVYLDLDAHRCCVAETEVDLTLREFELLRVLLEKPGKEFSREELLDEAWDSVGCAGPRTIDAHISRLRQKLGTTGMSIQTVRGSGYRFVEAFAGGVGLGGSSELALTGPSEPRRAPPPGADGPKSPETSPPHTGTRASGNALRA